MSFAFETGLITASVVGCLLVVSGYLNKKNEPYKTILSAGKKTKQSRIGFYNKILDKLAFVKTSEIKIEATLSVLGITDKAPRDITALRIFLGTMGLTVAILLRNALLAPLLFLVLANVPIILLEGKANKRRSLYDEQVLEALQIFVTDYTTTKSVQKTLEGICTKIKQPLKGEFERLGRKISSGVPVNECFLEFAKRTGNQWIMFFSQVMIMYFRNGGDFVPHLTGIIRTMSLEKLSEEQNKTELAGLKAINLALVLLTPIVFFISIMVSPEALMLFTQTDTGRYIVFFAIASCLFSLVMGGKIAEN